MLRVLGQSQRTIAWSYAIEFILVGLAASLLGVVLGYAGALRVCAAAGGAGRDPACPPPAWPAALGLGVDLTLLLAFGLPPVLQLAQVPPLRVIRRDMGRCARRRWWCWAWAWRVCRAAAGRQQRHPAGPDRRGGFAAAVAVFAVLSWLAVLLLRSSVNETTAPRWLVLATRQISARPPMRWCRSAAWPWACWRWCCWCCCAPT